jgi:hypothetical protein
MTAVVRTTLMTTVFVVFGSLHSHTCSAQSERAISLGEGKLVLQAPEKWVRREPRTRIVEHEFAVEGKKGQEAGRVTVMGAGGSIEDNIERWLGQFVQPDGKKSKEKAKIDKKTIAGVPVHVVDVSGTYKDMPGGPFARGKTIDRADYRMLGAIIAGGPSVGNYFIKFYGPQEIVKEHEKAFHKMVESLEKK